MEYVLKYSGRRTLAAEISRTGEVIVRAPYGMSKARIENFLAQNSEKIEKAVNNAKHRKTMYSSGDAEAEFLRKKAEEIIPQRVKYYSQIMGVEPQSVRITSATKRFGSCSNRGTLCFSLNLMQYTQDVIDYVVVHELAHLAELNHSKKFWAIVERYIPDYKEKRAKLKE